MKTRIVQSDTGVTLLGGGAVAAADVHAALTIAPVLVAADGGGDAALGMGLEPAAVIGDLDSLSAGARAHLGARVHALAEQDSTDFGKCLAHVAAPFFLGLGFTGLRLDHTLATLSDIVQEPRPVIVIGEEEVIFRAPTRLRLDLAPGTRVSLFPFGPVRGRSEGLRWPLEGLAFDPAGRVGTSNEALGAVSLEISGAALVLLPKAALRAALCGLGLSPARGG